MEHKCKNKIVRVSLVAEMPDTYNIVLDCPSKIPFEFVWLTRRWSLLCTGEDA
jgi:hypothetical protein